MIGHSTSIRDWLGYDGPVYQAGRVRYRVVATYFFRKPHLKLVARLSGPITDERKRRVWELSLAWRRCGMTFQWWLI